MISDYFVCVGAQKASTTWLFSVLNGHPDIFTTPVKEIHYFDHVRGIGSHLSDRRRRSRMRKYLQHLAFDWPRFPVHRSHWAWYRDYMRSPIDDSWYEDLFHHRGGARMAGEATPEYALLDREGLRHIIRLAPDARTIFVMRNPVAQAWSQFLHFEHKDDARAPEKGVEGTVRFWDSLHSAPFRDYPRTIDDLLAVFGSERTKFLFYEEMHADRAAAIASVCGFLGVDFRPDYFGDLGRTLNVSRPDAIPPDLHAHLVERHRHVVEAVRERLGHVPESWREEFSI